MAIFDWPTHGMFALYDTEYTTWEGAQECNWSRPGMYREVVQIGAVLINADDSTYPIHDRLDIYIRPKINPVLSDYFINLTGINNEKIQQSGVSLGAGLQHFCSFLEGIPYVFSHGKDHDILKENCQLHEIEWACNHIPFYDIRDHLRDACGLKEYVSVSKLPKALGLNFDGHRHNALDDMINLVKVIRHLRSSQR